MNPNVTEVPQDWALYKEVQEYYEKGMRVPDDVTLLWCDDNWGDIRRLPTAGGTEARAAAPEFIIISITSAARAITNGSTRIRSPKSGSR